MMRPPRLLSSLFVSGSEGAGIAGVEEEAESGGRDEKSRVCSNELYILIPASSFLILLVLKCDFCVRRKRRRNLYHHQTVSISSSYTTQPQLHNPANLAKSEETEKGKGNDQGGGGGGGNLLLNTNILAIPTTHLP